MAFQGVVTYPGIISWESFDFSDISGIQPSCGTIVVYPQDDPPAANGDLVITYGDNEIVIKKCHIDSASYTRDQSGKIVTCRIIDERWRWAFMTISGRYNIMLPNGYIDPAHEKNPQQLAELCFKSMLVDDYDVSILPTNARIEIDWVEANAAESLASLCDTLGCRIVPQRSTGTWFIRKVGEGEDLPDDIPILTGGDGIDPKEAPDYLEIVTAEIQYQVAVRLEPVARDMDLSWKTLDKVSYRTSNTMPYGFYDWDNQTGISRFRQRQADGTKISPQEMAQRSVWRCFRVAQPVKGIVIPGHEWTDEEKETPPLSPSGSPIGGIDPAFDENNVARKQLILSDQLVQTWTDDRGEQHRRMGFIFGSFYGDHAENGNYPIGTRIDYQGNVHRESPEEPASFSLSLDPIDTDRSILTTSKPMFRLPEMGSTDPVKPPFLFFMGTVQVRDVKTWQPKRYSRKKPVNKDVDEDELDANFKLSIVKNDIQPYYITTYNLDSEDTNGDPQTIDNLDDVNTQCDYYLDETIKTYETIVQATRTYIGLWPIDMDGKISQVSYTISKSGADTTASSNTEHDFDIPTYTDRRQRDGRRNSAEKLKLAIEITERRAKMKGTWGT